MQDLASVYRQYQASSGISTDTRKLKPDCFFIALRGANFDANLFVDEALKGGAIACLVDNPDLEGEKGCIYVPNSLTGLHRLAHYHRKRLRIPVIGLTGSNGKTTTKELIAVVLNQKYQVHATKGNLNNHIGVPLTLLGITPDTEIAIIEMGANQQGEIKMLCQLADPNFGLITNVGKAHLEGFGSMEVIRQTKYELLDHITLSNNIFFHNSDEPSLADLEELDSEKMIHFGSNDLLGNGEWKIIRFETIPSISFVISDGRKELNLESSLYGLHNLQNIKAALAVGAYFDVPVESMIQAISEYIPENNRSQIVKLGGNTFYLDAYNANPSSMSEGLDFFDQLTHDDKVLILGDMLELGDLSLEEHTAIIHQAKSMNDVQQIILVGGEFEKAARNIQDDPKIVCFTEVKNVIDWIGQKKLRGTYFFVKGSRGIQLEKIISGLK